MQHGQISQWLKNWKAHKEKGPLSTFLCARHCFWTLFIQRFNTPDIFHFLSSLTIFVYLYQNAFLLLIMWNWVDGGRDEAVLLQASRQASSRLGRAAADRSGAAQTDPTRRGHSRTRRRDRKARQHSRDNTERYGRDGVCQLHGNTEGTAFSCVFRNRWALIAAHRQICVAAGEAVTAHPARWAN